MRLTIQFDDDTWEQYGGWANETLVAAIQTSLMGLYGVKGVEKVSAEVDDDIQ